MRFVASMLAIVLLLLSTIGIAGRLFLLLPPDPTIITTTNDDGTGSLRWAIRTAPPGSTITFEASVKGLIALTSNDLSFTKSLTIRGPGAPILAISGGKSSHIVRVLPGITVTLSGMSFINSNVSGKGDYGFITNEGILTISDSIVSGNRGMTLGGGIANVSSGGKLIVVHSVVSDNSSKYGGGIYNENDLTLTDDKILGNAASEKGGGIYTYGGRTTITSCTISANTAHDGGGIFIDISKFPAKAKHSTITGNHADTHPDIAGELTLSP